MTLERSIAPKLHPIQDVRFPNVNFRKLSNGIPLYTIGDAHQNIVKLELVFKAGRSSELHPFVSKVCSHLLMEGTQKYDSEQLAEEIDFYGSTISIQSGMDVASISLYGLKKHFKASLDLLMEVLLNPTFPEEELAKYAHRSSERLRQELSKNNVVSYRKISEEIYGKTHPYGYNTKPENYATLELDKIKAHFQQCYTSDNCNVYLSGSVTEENIKILDQTLGQFQRVSSIKKAFEKSQEPIPSIFEIPGNKLQNSIKIGKKLFNRSNADFYPLTMLNTILGGYFGSRLMSSIREKKGYTYNIYSMMDPLEHDGSFYLSTEVGTNYQELTIQAIKEEFLKLQNDYVTEKELQMAKNYTLGTFLSALDGPLKSSKIYKLINENKMSISDFNQMVELVKSIDKNQILNLAQKYLNIDEMIQVSVGDF